MSEEWNELGELELGSNKVARSPTAFALYENPIAIAKGALGAPRIEDAALDETATTAGRDWVLDRIALATVGSLGTYIFAGTRDETDDEKTIGQTIAGSRLRPAGIRATQSFQFTNFPDTSSSHGSQSGTALSGTWQAMGVARTSATVAAATLWLRIA